MQARSLAIKALDYALSGGATFVSDAFIEALGLKTLFPALMGKVREHFYVRLLGLSCIRQPKSRSQRIYPLLKILLIFWAYFLLFSPIFRQTRPNAYGY